MSENLFYTPLLVNIVNFDAEKDYRGEYIGNGSKFKFDFYNIETNEKITYQGNLEGNYYVIPANTLKNTIKYRGQIFIGDGVSWSEPSSFDVFECQKTATVEPSTDIPKVIKGQSFTFNFLYKQDYDKLKFYNFKILDKNEKVFFKTGNVYNDKLIFDIKGFKNSESYTLYLTTVSQLGIKSEITPINFFVEYKQPALQSQTDVSCDPYSGDVTVRSVIKNIKGKMENKNHEPVQTKYVNIKDYKGEDAKAVELSNGNFLKVDTNNTGDEFVLTFWHIIKELNDREDLLVFNLNKTHTVHFGICKVDGSWHYGAYLEDSNKQGVQNFVSTPIVGITDKPDFKNRVIVMVFKNSGVNIDVYEGKDSGVGS